MGELKRKLEEEVLRFREINKYTKKLMNEQELPPVEPTTPVEDPTALPPVDNVDALPPVEDSPELPPVEGDDTSLDVPMDSTEELDITDLVNMTKSIKQDMEDNRSGNNDVIGKMDDVFTKLNDLEQKLSQMDNVISKIDELGNKVSQMKEPTPQEKLEMRSLDSYPFNQKPVDFFSQKQGEMQASGKNEYILTKQDVDNFSKNTIKDTFNSDTEDQQF